MSDEAKMLLAQLCVRELAIAAVRKATNDANVRLRARIRELEEALRPFADDAAELADGIPDDTCLAYDGFASLGFADFTVGDLRRARAVLEK